MSIKSFLTSSKKRTGLIISGILILCGLIPLLLSTFVADLAHPYLITQETLTSEDGTQINSLIYTPIGVTGNRPGVVIGHGFTGNALHMQYIAIELVKRGFVVVNIDFRGHGSSGGVLPSFRSTETSPTLSMDMMAGVAYLKSLGNVNQIGLVGHSMGSMTSLYTAGTYSDQINASVLYGITLEGYLSINPTFNISKVRNMMIANGRFEQMFQEPASLVSLQAYTNLTTVQSGVTYGNFTEGNASRLVMGITEHLFEPHDPILIYETVAWFEQAFNAGVISGSAITITIGINIASFFITIIGIVMLSFVLIVYLHKFLWKKMTINLQKDLAENTSIVKLTLLYILGAGLGQLGLLFPLGLLFSVILPISMGQLLYAQMVGTAVGAMIVYILLLRKTENLSPKDVPLKMKELSSENVWRSIILGICAAVILSVLIAVVASWSAIIMIPTLREIGAIFGMTILFFPWLFLKEFYMRTVQGKLKTENRIKEYFTMVGLGLVMDALLIVPLALLAWGGSFLIGFAALSLTVIILFTLIRQATVTWVYMYSGRNIIGSTIFMSIFFSYLMINFYPFGLPFF